MLKFGLNEQTAKPKLWLESSDDYLYICSSGSSEMFVSRAKTTETLLQDISVDNTHKYIHVGCRRVQQVQGWKYNKF